MTFQSKKNGRKVSLDSVRNKTVLEPEIHFIDVFNTPGQKDRSPGGYEDCIRIDERFFEADEDIQRQFYGY